MFPEAFVGGYPHSVMFNAMTESHFKNEAEFQKYHASAIDVPGKIVFPNKITFFFLSLVAEPFYLSTFY